jgi:ATP-binding cassette subfamily B protein
MKVFKLFFPYIRKNYRSYLFGLIGLLLVDGLQLIIPRINKLVIDELTFGTATDADMMRFGIYIMLLGLGMGITRFIWRYLIIGSSRKMEQDARDHFYEHLLSLSPKWFDKSKIGDIMALATNDLENVRMFFGMGFIAFFDAFIFGIAAFIMLLLLNTKLTLFALLPLPILTIIMRKLGPLLEKRSRSVQDSFSELTEKTREIFSGIRVVKAYVQEKKELENFSTLNDDYLKKNMKMVLLWGFFDPIIGMIIGLALGIVLFMGGKSVILTDMSIGDFVAFTSYLEYMIWPMMAIGWIVNLYQRAKASMSRLNKLLEDQADMKDDENAVTLDSTNGVVEFRNLDFAYNETKVLKGINLKIKSGEFISIIGRTGSGKSTLVNLIPRLYDPPEGTLFLDGYDVRLIKQESLRRLIGTVSQETFLFSESILSNILFSDGTKSRDEAIECAKIAQIHEQIMEFTITTMKRSVKGA